MTTQSTETIAKGARLSEEQRAQLGAQMRAEYEQGATVRDLHEKYGRSFGAVQRLLLQAGTTMRPRGGANRKV